MLEKLIEVFCPVNFSAVPDKNSLVCHLLNNGKIGIFGQATAIVL